MSCSAPVGNPAWKVACSIVCAGMPSASIAMPSFISKPITRLVKNPRLSLTTIGVFLISLAKSSTL